MTLRSRVIGAAIGAYLGAPGQRARHAAAEVARRVRRQPRAVDFFHDPTDPWSYLLAQAVARLAARYPVEWRLHVISPPSPDVDPAPAQRIAYALRDARDLAARWDLDFPDGARPLDPQDARWTGAVLIRDRPFADQLRAALELGAAGWRGDHAELQRRVGAWGHEAHVGTPAALARAYAALRAAGHYQGAMLAYGGEWYWGVDRLPYLEAALADDTGVAAGTGVLSARPPAPPARLVPGDGPVPLELWFSFRSPYSYLALDRVAELVARYPVELRLRPVLPMVMRALPVPWIKRRYLVRDARREAERMGVPFGRLADPLGVGVERCLAVAHHAIARGRGLDFLRSAARGIWAEARDVSTDRDLRAVAERAGFGWDAVRDALADDAWQGWARGNAEALDAAGLWGVPSFRVGDYATWGQDRLDFVEDRLRRHVAATRAG